MAEEVVDEENAKKGFDIKNLGMGAWIGIAVVALVIGLLCGRFLMGGGASGSALGKTTLTESELDTVVGSFTYNGTSTDLTARDVITQTSSLDQMQDEDGNYNIPTAASILSAAQNTILIQEAGNRGLEVSDDDLATYAEDTLGTSDYESIATSYSMDEDTVKKLLHDSALSRKLYDEVVGSENIPEAPEAPEAPTDEEVPTTDEEGNELSDEDLTKARNEFAKKEYADYIINLAGDEWDSEKGTWADEDGQYATALADYKITKKSATYEAADAAYYVAYQISSTAQSEVAAKWADFVNGLLSNASISISTLGQ